MRKSFYDWCVENNQYRFIDLWDYTLNNIKPQNIGSSSRRKMYFKCARGLHESEVCVLGYITNLKAKYDILCKKCRSIAQWGIDNLGDNFLEKYWGTKNTIDPFTIPYGSNIKAWFKCVETDYHNEYLIKCSYFKVGERCSYCGYHGLVDMHDSIGFIYQESFKLWSNKNQKSSYDYKCGSDICVYWKCDNKKHGDYKRKISDSQKCEFRCPICVRERKESLLQEKVRLYISDILSYKVIHEYDCSIIAINPKTNGKMPYDNEIVDLKLIIEVMGKQHYSSYFHRSKFCAENKIPEESFKDLQWRDKYKKEYALSFGYHYLEIPYTSEKNDEYKILIDNKIKEIQSKTTFST